jgi:tetratricopeptide (TPR) repeat protein
LELAQVLWGLWAFYLLRAELERTREIAEEFLRLADRLPYPGLEMRGHFALEITFMHLGKFSLAMDHFEKALSLYDPEQHLDDDFLYAQNPGVATRCHAAWALWFLGRSDQALQRVKEALTLARDLSEPHGLAHALFFRASVHQLRREDRLAQEHAEEAIEVSGEHGLALYHAMTTITGGWAVSQQGRQEEAIHQMRKGLAAYQDTGSVVLYPHFLALLAEALVKNGQPEEGLRVLEDALAMAHSNGEAYYQAELFRIKGEALLVQGTDKGLSRSATSGTALIETEPRVIAEAAGCFNQAIKIAQEQQARSWELRAAMSLARLFQKQGKQDEAGVLLTQVYERFAEGFDTADLREAKALLDELS